MVCSSWECYLSGHSCVCRAESDNEIVSQPSMSDSELQPKEDSVNMALVGTDYIEESSVSQTVSDHADALVAVAAPCLNLQLLEDCYSQSGESCSS